MNYKKYLQKNILKQLKQSDVNSFYISLTLFYYIYVINMHSTMLLHASISSIFNNLQYVH